MHEYKVETKKQSMVSAGGVYTGVAATTALTLLMGPVGLAIGVGGMGAGYGYTNVIGAEDVVLPPPIPRLGPPKKWVKLVFTPLVIIAAVATLVFDTLVQAVSLLVSCTFGELCHVIRAAFAAVAATVAATATAVPTLDAGLLASGALAASWRSALAVRCSQRPADAHDACSRSHKQRRKARCRT